MDDDRYEQLSQSVRFLAESYRATAEHLERTLRQICDELDRLQCEPSRPETSSAAPAADFSIDRGRLTVTFRGRCCFFGNTYPFRLLDLLARNPDVYVTYEELLAEVWEGSVRSDDAVRSAVKRLRVQLRRLGMADLADAIDGSVPGRYCLKLG